MRSHERLFRARNPTYAVRGEGGDFLPGTDKLAIQADFSPGDQPPICDRFVVQKPLKGKETNQRTKNRDHQRRHHERKDDDDGGIKDVAAR